ncbi:helix-turn-helix transcriptional regulator [Streptomyces luteireticuli]|uniref:LuxR family transcriptional regulator n=1 Tax=Streptomyces luteireticuli TaxID=173858 RepID=A0ABN0YMY9_9ACTN
MIFAERSSEIALLRELFAQAQRQRAQVALIEGAVASGKTVLLHTFGEEAAGAGALVLTAMGSRAERSHPFGVLSQLFHDLHDRKLQTWADDQISAFLSQPPGESAPDQDPVAMKQTTAHIARGLCTALLEFAADRPIVIGIDDVQYADTPSLQVLLYLLRRLKTDKLLVVLTEWTISPLMHPAFRAELLRQPNCHGIRLRPLSVGQVAEVLTEYLNATAAELLAPAYHDVCGGNPLLLRGLIEDGVLRPMDDANALPAAPSTEESFRQAVFACLYRWDQSAIDVARGLAVLDGPAEPRLLGQLVGMERPRVVKILDSLAGSRLLRDGQLRHPAVRTAVLDTLPLDDQVGLHLRAAQLLHDGGADAGAVARHLVAAGSVPGQWAVGVLQDAGTQALAEANLRFTLSCLELAQRTCEDPVLSASLTLSLTELLWSCDPSAAARYLTPLKEAAVQGDLERSKALTVAFQLFWHGRTQQAHELIGWFKASAGTAGAQGGSSSCPLKSLQHWLHLGSQPPHNGLDTLDALEAPGGQGTAAPRSAQAALLTALHEGMRGRVADWAENALATTLRLSSKTMGEVQFALSTLIHTGRTGRAATFCRKFVAEARAQQTTTWEALLTSFLAEVSLRQGALDRAVEQAQDALQLISARGWGTAIGHPLSVQLLALTALSRHEEAARVLRQAVPEGMFQSPSGLRYLRARGHHYLATHRPGDAYLDFHRCGELARSWSLDLPELVPWRTDLALAHLALGRGKAARELLVEQLAMPGAHDPRVRGLSLRALAAAEDGKRRTALLREAVDLLGTSGDQTQLAFTLAELSRAHHESGEFSRARLLGQQALQLAEDCGAQQLCRTLLSTGDAAKSLEDSGADGVEALSDAERRVAALAAVGHTNREIARELYITVSTVEQHLTRVYRKLHVKQRADLPLRLKESGDHGSPELAAAGTG